MGIEIGREFGGAGLGFMSAIITIEELAKVDPAVSILCDIHVQKNRERTLVIYICRTR
jgi:short/branched chain acyl-CoA dehydrogenase